MKEIAIIGAGQLGSRHLQGVLKSILPFNVFVIDPSKESLAVAKERALEVEHNHKVKYLTSINELPSSLEFAIIATNANIRLSVLLELLEQATTSTLILEKVLFQRTKDYKIAEQALKEHGVSCYVNHPRRMQDIYARLRNLLASREESFSIHAYGANWGLGCNGLHISDMLEFVLNDTIKSYNNSRLDASLVDSKRSGFKEFSGTISGETLKGHQFSITSELTNEGKPSPISIIFNSPDFRINVFEGTPPSLTIADSKSNWITEHILENPIRFQSDLSRTLVDKFLNQETINLPRYEQAMSNHLLFIDSLIKHIELTSNKQTEICPIT